MKLLIKPKTPTLDASVSIRIDPATKRRLDAVCDRLQCSVTAILTALIESYLDEDDVEQGRLEYNREPEINPDR